ncbi:hypothetical protein O6P43_009233 [Quillaja saponaria]|uniref:Uncharacterized protein n=1 Tax=Quillaja saponaria TaxID=32244 RepID=A0AAD7PXT1_QUISA|nr:hypothetical protein O6P43_009233 [Quillaja saponaria]
MQEKGKRGALSVEKKKKKRKREKENTFDIEKNVQMSVEVDKPLKLIRKKKKENSLMKKKKKNEDKSLSGKGHQIEEKDKQGSELGLLVLSLGVSHITLFYYAA